LPTTTAEGASKGRQKKSLQNKASFWINWLHARHRRPNCQPSIRTRKPNKRNFRLNHSKLTNQPTKKQRLNVHHLSNNPTKLPLPPKPLLHAQT
jgi:hypothetical protein